MDNTITFKAIFQWARTTIDGNWRVTLEVDHQEAEAMLKLAKMHDNVFKVVMKLDQKSDLDTMFDITT